MTQLSDSKKDMNKIYQISRGNNNKIFSKVIISSSGKLSICSDYERNIKSINNNIVKVKYNIKDYLKEEKYS